MKPEIFTSVHALRGAYGDAPWCMPRQTLDLVATVEHHMSRADAAEQECARLRARVAELEALATGPRSLTIDAAACDAIDGGATAGPRHVDATGREVLP